MNAAQYLRKSRMEDGMDTQEVLSKHRKALAEFAERNGICIAETYYEVVSGESLYARPEMLRLLKDVENGRYDAVLCMDLDRLSRGRMRDQGTILDTLRESGTLLITPDKTYDLSDEWDDEIAEFKTFLSRREYKLINKRLRRGLQQSIKDGCYIANAPYGYRKTTVDKKPTLEICQEEAAFVRMMFSMYADGYSCAAIADHMNLLGAVPHRSAAFSRNAVANILGNPTYTGSIVWNRKSRIKKAGSAKLLSVPNRRELWITAEGLHPAIIERKLFDEVQERLTGRRRPNGKDGTLKATLAGLIYCGNCGRPMQRLPLQGEDYLICTKPGCCAGAKYALVEAQLLAHLREQLRSLTAERSAEEDTEQQAALCSSLALVKREKHNTEGQRLRLHELLETGIYTPEIFRERMQLAEEKLAALAEKEAVLLQRYKDSQHKEAQEATITTVLDAYAQVEAPQRNALLHAVISSVEYRKEKKSKPAEFFLKVTLKPF